MGGYSNTAMKCPSCVMLLTRTLGVGAKVTAAPTVQLLHLQGGLTCLRIWGCLFNSIKVRGKGKTQIACIARTARKHEALMARNMMSNHTDMQDKYCGDCYDIHPIQSQYKGNHLLRYTEVVQAATFVYWL